MAGRAAWLGLRAFAALRPTAFPYLGRAILEVPRPLITRKGLLSILDPAPGERILEIGPGTGYYTLPVATLVRPQGMVDIVDVRQAFLDHTVEAARRRGLLVIGEVLIDPDFPGQRTLTRRAQDAGLALERHTGTPLGYFARFIVAPGAQRA